MIANEGGSIRRKNLRGVERKCGALIIFSQTKDREIGELSFTRERVSSCEGDRIDTSFGLPVCAAS